MTWEFIFFLALVVLAGTGGELCIARAMKGVGEVTDFHPATILRTIIRAVKVGWTWIGVALLAIAFFSLLGALSLENVSFVIPVSALNYAAGAFGGRLFLHERVSPKRWAGIFLVCVGVTLVVLGRK